MSAGLLLLFSNKDLIPVFTEDKPSVKIPDLSGRWDGEASEGGSPFAGHLNGFNNRIGAENNSIATKRWPVGYSESVKFLFFLFINIYF